VRKKGNASLQAHELREALCRGTLEQLLRRSNTRWDFVEDVREAAITAEVSWAQGVGMGVDSNERLDSETLPVRAEPVHAVPKVVKELPPRKTCGLPCVWSHSKGGRECALCVQLRAKAAAAGVAASVITEHLVKGTVAEVLPGVELQNAAEGAGHAPPRMVKPRRARECAVCGAARPVTEFCATGEWPFSCCIECDVLCVKASELGLPWQFVRDAIRDGTVGSLLGV
jgi:hypothetical protein